MGLLSIIISACTILWAVYAKARQKHFMDSAVLGLLGLSLLCNTIFVYLSGRGMRPDGIGRSLQLLTEMMIIPLVYMYFSGKTGRRWGSPALVILWVLILEGLIPSWIMVLDHDFSDLSGIVMEPHMIYLTVRCKVVFSIYAADFVTIIQGLVTAFTIVPTIRLVRRYGLRFNKGLRAFVLWWIADIAFAFINSMLTSEQLASSAGQWFFLGGMFILLNSIFTVMALNMDSDPILISRMSERDRDEYQDQEDETSGGTDSMDGMPVDVDSFIALCHEMASQVRYLIEEEKVYLDPEYNTEKAVMHIGTNRTYFAKMMQAEFGCRFTDMLNDARVEYARELLMTTDLTVAEVAEKSGFSGAPTLSRRFSMKYGAAPSEYRKEHRPS